MEPLPIANPTASGQVRCPGEVHPISRAVHLARLEAGYPGCVHCPHRNDSAASPRARKQFERLARKPKETIFRTNGIRGVYRNHLSREVMSHLGSAVAAILWEQSPPRLPPLASRPYARTSREADVARGNAPALAASSRHAYRHGPRVVVGQDNRFSSPDLAVGLVTALRRSGCAVVDVGTVHRPAVDFAVDHLHAELALFVTGGGCPGDWNGLDVIGREAVTCSVGGRLDEVEIRAAAPLSRPTRLVGPYRVLPLLETYAAGLQHHFHALRPLKVGVVSANATTAEILQKLVAQLPCRIHVLPSPAPFGEEEQPPAKLCDLLADVIRREHLDLGFLIASDGRACFVLDECGEPLRTEAVLTALTEARDSGPNWQGPIVIPSDVVIATDLPLHRAPGTSEEQLLNARREQPCSVATDGGGRYWITGSTPACDAIIVLARILQFASLSDRPLSTRTADPIPSARP